MGEERDWLFDENDVMEVVRRYEDMMKKRKQFFFDVHEFEEIINFYIDTNNYHKAVSAAEYAYRMYPSSTIIQLKLPIFSSTEAKLWNPSPSLINWKKLKGQIMRFLS